MIKRLILVALLLAGCSSGGDSNDYSNKYQFVLNESNICVMVVGSRDSTHNGVFCKVDFPVPTAGN
jgi:uncharacterized protein YcfL